MRIGQFILVGAVIWGLAGQIQGTDETTLTVPNREEILSRLKKTHPRLLLAADDFDRLRRGVRDNPELKRWYGEIQREAHRMLSQPPSKYELPDGKRLLATSRRVLDRVSTLAFVYRLDGDRRYVERAWTELSAAAKFPNWNPNHFLDTAELACAFGVGYDWLYDAWTAEQRTTLRAALIKMGLEPGLASYRGTKGYGWWVNAHHNWNQVCNGGIGIGALALMDEEPDLCVELLQGALKSFPRAMTQYAPDGGWAEGPGYWHYATSYNVRFLAALDSALETDFGLSRIAGFDQAGWFPVYVTGPLGLTFNFADGGDGTIRATAMFWLARRFDRPEYAAYQRQVAAPSVLDLIWSRDDSGKGSLTALPLDKYFRGTEVATFRSSWTDRNGVFAGLKAGDNKANHSHLDLGSFVLDALGERWALDFGKEDYNLPGYFGRERWTYYRLRAEGHNTLVINPGQGPDQDPRAVAKIIRFDSKPARSFAIADLTAPYAAHVRQAQRGLALLDRKTVIVQDELTTKTPSEVWWFMHTSAGITLTDKSTALLRQGSARLSAKILSPADASFAVLEARPLPASPDPRGQRSNRSIQKLAIHFKDATDLRIVVQFSPVADGKGTAAATPAVSALAEW